MRINNNMMAMNTQRYLSINNSNSSKSIEKLSSGYRINRAGDDAAGLAISEKMRSQIRGLDMAAKNSQDAISLIQTAEGALTETQSILQRMSELAVQSASDTNQDLVDRQALQQEFNELKNEINDTANTTKFNGKVLLDGSFGGTGLNSSLATTASVFGTDKVTDIALSPTSTLAPGSYTISATDTAVTIVDSEGTNKATLTLSDLSNGATSAELGDFTLTLAADFEATNVGDYFKNGQSATFTISDNKAIFQTGSAQNDELELAIGDMSTTGLSIDGDDIGTRAGAQAAITSVNNAINTVSTERAKLGAYQNRLEHKINSLNISAENLQSAESRIRDVDMAKEMMNFTKNNILSQAATAMLAQANQAPQTVLQLLR